MMIPKLPLRDPRWRDLDGARAEDVKTVLEQMAAATGAGAGDAWRQSWARLAEDLIDDGTVSDGAYAALPYLVEAAAALPAGQAVDFWVDLGFIVTAEDRPPVPADLRAGFGAALRLAEQAALRSFLLADAPARVCASLALSCVAFAGHRIGAALWDLHLQEGHLLLVCPGCGHDTEIADFFVDPVRPPFEAPGLPDPADARPAGHPWGEVADVLRGEALGEGWEAFLRVARGAAEAGVPPETPGQAVLCLVAGMVAAKGTPQWAGREWARKLVLLTGAFRCWSCEQTWTIADGLSDGSDDARPPSPLPQAPSPGSLPQIRIPRTAAAGGGAGAATEPGAAGRSGGAVTRLRQDGNAPLAADGVPWGPVPVFSAAVPGPLGGVNSLAVVTRPDRSVLVAGAGDAGVVCLWDPADGRLVHGPLEGHPDPVRSMTSLLLPDGRVLLASGGGTGAIALWDTVTGQPVLEPVGNWLGEVTGMCTAVVPDGRTLLVSATSRGAVRLRDPASGEAVGRLNPSGRPIQAIAALPISAGHTLIAAADAQGGVQVWDPAVEDPWDRGAAVQLNERALKDADHRVATVAAVPGAEGTLLATGDRRGVVMLWDPATGAPVGDGLPPATSAGGTPAMAAATSQGGRTVLVTALKGARSLRVWEPETGAVQHIALDVVVTCVAAAGPVLVVGHDAGVLALPLRRP
ncbi:WD40 repeat domain-containing protein [Kitasatospora indigofera]|uniref:WD40 repeat domain-containing protein n=1 Tax=Kitasatospora indigofera TaxID=67307 RepID=UPI00363C8E60